MNTKQLLGSNTSIMHPFAYQHHVIQAYSMTLSTYTAVVVCILKLSITYAPKLATPNTLNTQGAALSNNGFVSVPGGVSGK